MSQEKQDAIKDLATQLTQCVQAMKSCENNIQLANNQKKKAELVIAEVEKQPENQNVFRSLGRMFVLQPRAELAKDLTNDMETLEK